MPDLDPENQFTVTDPLCGKALCIDQVVSEQDHGGWVYFFCSRARRKRFFSDPERYATNDIHPPSGADNDRP